MALSASDWGFSTFHMNAFAVNRPMFATCRRLLFVRGYVKSAQWFHSSHNVSDPIEAIVFVYYANSENLFPDPVAMVE